MLIKNSKFNYRNKINPAFAILEACNINPLEIKERRWIYLQIQRQRKIPNEIMEIIRLEVFQLLINDPDKDFSYQEYLFCEYSLFEVREIGFTIDELDEEILDLRVSAGWYSILKEEKWFRRFIEDSKKLPLLTEKNSKLNEEYIKLNQKFYNLFNKIDKSKGLSWSNNFLIESACILTEGSLSYSFCHRFDEIGEKVKTRVKTLEERVKELELKLGVFDELKEHNDMKELVDVVKEYNLNYIK